MPQGDAVLRRLHLDDAGGLLQQAFQIKGGMFQLDLAGFQFVHVQHIVDQIQQKTGCR